MTVTTSGRRKWSDLSPSEQRGAKRRAVVIAGASALVAIAVGASLGLRDLSAADRRAARPNPAPSASRASLAPLVDLPASREDLLARLRAADPTVQPGPWATVDPASAARNSRLFNVKEYRSSLGAAQFLRVYERPDGTLREVGVAVMPGVTESQVNAALVNLVFVASRSAKVSAANEAVATLDTARLAGRAAKVPLGDTWVGIFPGADGGFAVWAVPGDQQELALEALQRALHADDDKTVGEALSKN